jgi:protein-S-isoprenylcysteine O-methyltransferase Ste14
MNPWYAKTVVVVASVVIGVIRAAHSYHRGSGPVAKRLGGVVETLALGISLVGFVIPILWVVTPILNAANYPSHAAAVAGGAAVITVALWLFHRTHVTLGRNWSSRLQILQAHELITEGIYRHVRHPMYLSLILYGVGQAAVIPNLVAGLSCLVGNVLLFALRFRREEQMIRARFGPVYDAYAARTRRLIPGLW